MFEKLIARVLFVILGLATVFFGATELEAQTAAARPRSRAVPAAPSAAASAARGAVEVEVELADVDTLRLRLDFGTPTPDRVQIADRELPALALDGAGFLQDPGYPLVPRRRVLVEIPPAVDVQLSAVIEEEQRLGRVDLVPMPQRVVDELSGESTTRELPFVAARGLLPESTVRLEYVGWLRHRRVACLDITPVRYDPASGQALATRVLRIELSFTARGSASASARTQVVDAPWFESLYARALANPGSYYATTSPGAPAATSLAATSLAATVGPPQSPASRTELRWRLKVELDQRGLYEITRTDLLAAGIDPATVDPRRLGMTRRGASIAIEVEGEADGSFDNGDRVLFYAEPDSDRYRDLNAWWLFEVLAAPGTAAYGVRRMQTVDGTPQAGDTPLPFFRETLRAEGENKYWQTMPSPQGHDHWFWRRSLAPASNDYSITTPDPEPGGSNLRVRAALHGYTDTVQSPDHHTRLLLNGNQVDDANWDGAVPFLHDVSASAALLQSGLNTIRVQQFLDLGAVVAGLYSDWVEVEYDRDFVADGDELAWTNDSTQIEAFAVEQLSVQSVHALVVGDTNSVQRIVNAQLDQPGGGYRVTFRHAPAGGQRYFVAAEAAVRAPLAISAGSAPIVAPPLGADLLIIAEDSFASALAPLVQQREQSGLRVAVVSPQAIYDSYAAGEFNPEAIQDFVQDAFQSWPAPAPSFLMLVGEASLDYRDHWNNGPWNSAPAYLYQTNNNLELPADHLYTMVAGADILPDLFVGRLPVGTPADATTLVSKIMGYVGSPPAGSWQTEVVQISDFGLQFINALDVAAMLVPGALSVTPVYADVIGSSSATHNAIMSELGQGCLVATYFGHGAVYNWGVGLLDTGDIGGLANGAQLPLVNMLNCLTGFYAINNPPGSPPRCLAEELLLAPSGGAVSAIAPSGLGATWEYQRLLGHLYTRLFAGESLGEAQTGAKVDSYLIDVVDEHNLWSCILFGDPTQALHLP